MQFSSYLASTPLAFILLAGLLGLIIGSFLNVVILRVPRMLEIEWQQQAREILEPDREHEPPATYNLILPHSHCPKCKTEIKPWQNIPVISYLLLRGRCGNCKEPISLRYPAIELLTAGLSMLVAWQMGFGLATAGMLVLTWALICLSMIDADTQLLPDIIVLPLLWLGLILNNFGVYTDLNTALWGAVAGYLSLWSVYWLFKLVTGKEGMGYGDFKLLAMLGAWGGWQVLPLTILLSSLVGAILGIIILKARGASNSTPLPFGPYLAIAGWIALIWGETITDHYLRFAGF
ncbi:MULTISPECIES: A24 family peptidase [Pseudomonas]|jgi:leader peptidase (prepilin peptidase)/N-methyltransferase|uniref:Prepilin leader peptidase/N-methyltransferase n=1 Tax=Pseudomonas abyssi TaxID=170540 RepID=A0A2A3MC61_9PSED|nr:A24 family peptidase [Pseudomonas abyssi]MAC99782.1 prepilin peptidase [Pseudomonadales bacterium]PBK02398.1 prepilin peptidase [Pseudomonas abyssi]|tara:strand:+ start:3699 stop:4571 length:873 start_codon:yes stop_codon:yes gene_type:complete